jgi:hypothetical protein
MIAGSHELGGEKTNAEQTFQVLFEQRLKLPLELRPSSLYFDHVALADAKQLSFAQDARLKSRRTEDEGD